MGRALDAEVPVWLPAPQQQRCSPFRRMCFRVLFLLTFVLFFHRLHQWGFFGSLEGPISSVDDSPPKSAVETCTSAACIHASSSILYNLSPNYKNIDPCENFEEYVCGGWREEHDLRPDQGSAFTGTFMAERGQTLLRHILEAPYPKDSKHSYFSPMNLATTEKSADERNFDKMKAAYDACMNVDDIKAAGDKPLLEFLSTFDVAKTVDGDIVVQPTLRWLSYHGVQALVSIYAGADDTDPDTVVVSVAAPRSIGLPSKERYEDDELVKKYGDVMKQVLKSLYPKEPLADLSEEILEFEKKLAAASPTEEDRESVEKYYNPMTLEEAASLCPQIDLSNMVKAYANQTGTVVNRVIVNAPQYLKDLTKILDETDAEIVQGYLIWKTTQSFSPFVEAKSITPYQRFAKELAGQDPDAVPERWRTCVRYVDGSLGWILSRFFVEKAFSAAAKELGDRIIYDIKDEFILTLGSTKWMKERDVAIKKVHAIIQKIGYPTTSPNIMDPPTLENYYEKLDIKTSSYFNNSMKTRVFDVKSMWDSLGKPVDHGEWGMTASTVNAYYNPPGSEIVFPAGIMQFPVFDVGFPEYLSYGAFASVAGHELSHAFDSTGRHYDETGNYTDWWSDETVEEFKTRAQCFIDQYSNFTITGPDGKEYHINGRLTQGENIADAGGVNAAFAAWKKRATAKPNPNLPGLEDFTQEQLFHINYAQWWCGETTPQTALNLVYTDPHSPKEARVLGTMANAKSFKESFSCPVKEPTCKLW